ncbi:hypothetical protein MASR1M32_36560 [Rhodobacter sp.]
MPGQPPPHRFRIRQAQRHHAFGPDAFDLRNLVPPGPDIARGHHPDRPRRALHLGGEPVLDREIRGEVGIAHLAPQDGIGGPVATAKGRVREDAHGPRKAGDQPGPVKRDGDHRVTPVGWNTGPSGVSAWKPLIPKTSASR